MRNDRSKPSLLPGRRLIALSAAALLSCRGAHPSGPRPAGGTPLAGVFAIVDVNVLPLSVNQVLAHYTVIIRDGRVAEIGPATTTRVDQGIPVLPVPPGAFVMPGLMDFHVHTFDPAERWLFLAHGVTSVRNMHGTETHLRWRDSLAQGQIDGPRLFTSGPILDGSPPSRSTNTVVTTPAEGHQAVVSQVRQGYDYIKIYDNIAPDVYDAIIAEAERLDIAVIGHLPSQVGLRGLLGRRVQREIDHLEELLPYFEDGRSAAGIREAADLLARRGIAITPTISVFTSALAQSRDWPALQRRPDLAFVNPETRRAWGWDVTAHSRHAVPAALERYERTVTFMRNELLPALRRAGVEIVAGTDTPIPVLIPGISLLEELEEYRRSGLSSFEVLRSATVTPSALIPASHGDLRGLGTISRGVPADLLVLHGNPLKDLSVLRTPIGVVSRGKWFSKATLELHLDSLATGFTNRE